VESLTLHLLQGSRVLRTYPVALGKPSTPTPVGRWRIRTKLVNPAGVLGTRWMGLNVPWGNYGIHGTNSPWSIGRYVSGGCIRMYNHHVEEVYERVIIGTPVAVVGRYPGQPRVLTRGMRGPQVAAVQQRLRQLGYDPGPVDGIFGPRTEESVRRFQRDRGLVPDGVVGEETRDHLFSTAAAGREDAVVILEGNVDFTRL